MNAYIIELEKARPEEGTMVFATPSQLADEVASLKAIQQQQAATTA